MELFKELEGELRIKEPLQRHTSFKVGGNAEVLFYPKNESSLVAALKIAKKNHMPVFVLGNGSNLLVRDGGIHGLVISLKEIKSEIEKKQDRKKYFVTASAGISMMKLVRHTINEGMEGLETLIGVPGTLGGAIKMNAGAEGKEIGDVIWSVKLMNMNGEIKDISKNEINFNYRNSEFPENGIFLNATLELKQADKEALLKKVREMLDKRSFSQPVEESGAGSIFKNPEGHFAGQLIESAGLKGYAVGDAMVSPKHANFIVNRGNARAKDIEELIKAVQEKVMDKTGISLQPEIKIAGEY